MTIPLLLFLLLPVPSQQQQQQRQQQQSLSSCIGSAVSQGMTPQILDGTPTHECPTDASWVVAARMDNTTGNVYYITWSYILTAEGQSIRSQVRLNSSSDGTCTVIVGTGTYTPVLYGSSPASCISPTEPYCLMLPTSLLLDEARSSLYISDNYNARVLKFSTLDGTLSTVAGGAPGGVLLSPVSLAMDSTGGLVILDAGSGSIQRVVTTASGAITPVVTAHPQLFGAGGVAVMRDGSYAVAATQAGLVLKVNPSTGAVSRFAGQGLLSTTSYWDNLCPLLPPTPSTATVPTTPPCFFLPTSITVDPTGNVIVSDVTFSSDYATVYSQVRSLAFDTGAVVAVYPTLTFPLLASFARSAYIPPNFLNQSYTYFPCDVWALPVDVLASYAAGAASRGGMAPAVVVVPPSGTILASTWDGGQVVLLPPTSTSPSSPPPKLLTHTLPLTFGGDGGPAKFAYLNKPTGMQYDAPTSTLYITDSGNHRIRMVGPTGVIQTIVGSNKGALVPSYGTTYRDCSGVVDVGGAGTSACLSAPVAVALSPPPDPTCSAYSPLGRAGGVPSGDLYILEAGSGGVYLNLNPNERAAGALPGVIPGRLRVMRGGGVSGVMRTLYTGGKAPPLTLFTPISMAFDACDGALYVAEQTLGVIYRFPATLLLQSAASPGLPIAQFIVAGMPNGLGLVFGDNALSAPFTLATITAPLQLYLGGNSSTGVLGPTGLVVSRALEPGNLTVFFIDAYSNFVRCLTAAVLNSTGALGPFSVTTVAGFGGGGSEGGGGV